MPRRLGLLGSTPANSALSGAEALQAWQSLCGHECFQSTLVEADKPVRGSRLVGFGASFFVTSQFVDAELAAPARGLGERILLGTYQGTSPLLTHTELRQANTVGGLDVVILCGAVRQDLACDDTIVQRTLPYLAEAFLEIHRGYRMSRVLVELLDPQLRQRVEQMGTWRIMEHSFSATPGKSALAVMEREDALAREGSIPALLFNFQEPYLGLSEAEQGVPRYAVYGLPDRSIAASLRVSCDTLKTHWSAILRKMEAAIPALFADLPAENGRVRGPQRRHLVVAHVRRNPQELRPCDRKLADKPSLSRPRRSPARADAPKPDPVSGTRRGCGRWLRPGRAGSPKGAGLR